jgi:YHS domain-containing protein
MSMPNSVKDPVCGMMIDPSSARCQGEYCFCSDECLNKFIVNPGRYMRR